MGSGDTQDTKSSHLSRSLRRRRGEYPEDPGERQIKVPLTSYESPEEVRDDLARGAITAIVSGNFFSQAYLAVYVSAQSLLQGRPLPQGWVKVPHVIVDKDNIAAYQKAWEKPETGLRAFFSTQVEATRDHLPATLPSPELFVHPAE